MALLLWEMTEPPTRIRALPSPVPTTPFALRPALALPLICVLTIITLTAA
jgi:hypothetical protein